MTKTIPSGALKKRLIKSILFGLTFFLTLAFAFYTISQDFEADETAVVIRRFYQLNERISAALQSETRLSVEKTKPAKGKVPRVNGDEGLQSDLDLKNYKILVTNGLKQLSIKPDEIYALPATEVTTDFKCIEGWSAVIHYKGLRFSDFLKNYDLGKKTDGTYYKYVALETPDQQYYVSIDMKSMLHPQTVLAYEMNETKLSLKNGAPLRLIIPIKYGVKSIKRIGFINFSDELPKDFWTEQGYDWYSGL